jgi:hypothetical protein
MDPYPLFPDIHVVHTKGKGTLSQGQEPGTSESPNNSEACNKPSNNSKLADLDDSDDDEGSIVDAADVVKKSRAHVTHMVRAMGAINSANASDDISMAHTLSRISRNAIRHAARNSEDPDLEVSRILSASFPS